MRKPSHIIALVFILVGALDLLLGNTNHPLLPAFIGNELTQQRDIGLIGIGTLLILWY